MLRGESVLGIDRTSIEWLRAQPDPQRRAGLADECKQRLRTGNGDRVDQSGGIAHRSGHDSFGVHTRAGVGGEAGDGTATRWLEADEPAVS